jgi:hypothetical protein
MATSHKLAIGQKGGGLVRVVELSVPCNRRDGEARAIRVRVRRVFEVGAGVRQMIDDRGGLGRGLDLSMQ